jgi:hypothetical protein
LYSNEENDLQEIQMERCQPIKRLRDKKKKEEEELFLNSLMTYLVIMVNICVL